MTTIVAATRALDRYCRETLRADLIGIADIGRCAHAPPRLSPQGILPTARSVIVMAVHHPDACIELDGRRHPQEIGPYRVQYRMNQRLDEMSLRLANHLSAHGHAAVPIFSSNSWRYRGYREMTEQFAPDVSHMHMACAAGLAEFGYQGLAITPEYGARQRYVTVITDAVFTPTPLREPGSVCDRCMLCRQHCRSRALSEELDGWHEVPIGDKIYRYVRKNLWRCAWGEHFDLDLDLPLPPRITPAVIDAAIARHGLRGGEMGSCLRHCLPPARRVFDRTCTDAPRRRRDAVPAASDLELVGRLAAAAAGRGADGLVVQSLPGPGWDDHLPGAIRAVTVRLRRPRARMPQADDSAGRILAQSCYDLARTLEAAGFDAICETTHDEAVLRAGVAADDDAIQTQSVLTTCPLVPTTVSLMPPPTTRPPDLADLLDAAGHTCEYLLHGVADADALDRVADQLRPHWAEERELTAVDQGGWQNRFGPMRPAITEQPIVIAGPTELLPGARRVLVLGLPLPAAAVACHGRPPAEAPGPLALLQYGSQVLLRLAAWRVVRELEAHGCSALVSQDLPGTGSWTGNPRGPQRDAFCNRFAAVAAGLAHLGRCGAAIHPAHGANLRTISIVTDAPLPVSAPLPADQRPACTGCRRCLDACPVGAFRAPITLDIAGTPQSIHPIDRRRCDWAKRYSLVARAGTGLLGWSLDLQPPAEITPAALTAALEQLPGIERHRPCNAETCVLACPHSR